MEDDAARAEAIRSSHPRIVKALRHHALGVTGSTPTWHAIAEAIGHPPATPEVLDALPEKARLALLSFYLSEGRWPNTSPEPTPASVGSAGGARSASSGPGTGTRTRSSTRPAPPGGG